MWPSLLPERRAAHFPAARAARKGGLGDPRRRAVETVAQPELRRRPPKKPIDRLLEQTLARAVHEPQRLRPVEGEHGDVDFDHHRAEQGAGFERAEALVVQHRRQHVHFEQHGAERIVLDGAGSARAARANRKIALAQRRQQVRQRL